jgi:Sec-independent protein translocase protein TatA
LPDIASGLGKGLRDFKKVMQEPDEPIRTDPPDEPTDEPPREGKKREDA